MATTRTIILLVAGVTMLISIILPGSCQRLNRTAPEPMGELCMGCICEAATQCNRAKQCRNGVCGLFAITRPYWEDAGMPIIAGDENYRPGAFERCVTEPFCAALTIQEYMARYPQDCDGNGIINCQDYAAIHHLGRGCVGSLNPAYRRQFTTCLRLVKPTGK